MESLQQTVQDAAFDAGVHTVEGFLTENDGTIWSFVSFSSAVGHWAIAQTEDKQRVKCQGNSEKTAAIILSKKLRATVNYVKNGVAA